MMAIFKIKSSKNEVIFVSVNELEKNILQFKWLI